MLIKTFFDVFKYSLGVDEKIYCRVWSSTTPDKSTH